MTKVCSCGRVACLYLALWLASRIICFSNGETCWDWTVKAMKRETRKEGIQASYDDKSGTDPGDHGRRIGQRRGDRNEGSSSATRIDCTQHVDRLLEKSGVASRPHRAGPMSTAFTGIRQG
ncbi:hypothetical protein COCVIDRAFT_11756 [Bipolaris victoriae FI3]|uniref:Secreted protein n=1 Tax=Bipolaris victoriae (strain FI3) TaxID=930091 RepID=W7EVF6_BIPV3|nr:hypothetical protein COCVIDRAFT_11756 [Bipolaris victoriae FI3]